MKDVFYIGVNEPNEIRKSVLESMREVVLVLKSYDHFRLKRMEKAVKITKLKDLVKEIDSLFSKLKRDMPKSGVRVKTGMKISKGKNRNSRTNIPDSVHRSHVNKLARELEEIESRLEQLG